ncbi:MAG: S1 family peptidase [Acetobacteraceae bacterium]
MRFLAQTSLAGLTPLVVAARPLLEDYARLQEFLRARAGDAAAKLFAEPVITWGNGANPGSVAWYTEVAGESELLATVPAERRTVVGGRLRAALTALWPLRADPAVAAALTLAGPEGVLAVGDEAVLIGWGLAPSGRPAAAGDFELAAVFGPYVPTASPPGIPSQAVPATGGFAAALPSAPPPPSGAGPAAASAFNLAAATPPHGRPPWLLPAGLALLAVCLAFGIWFGLGIFPRRTSFAELGDPATLQAAIGLAEAQNRTLQAEIAAEQKSLAGNVCRLPAAASGAVPLMQPVAPAALPPSKSATFHGSLLALLRQATVMVAADAGPGRIVTGSGFFFAPNLVMTNRHVVADAKGPILVVSEALRRPIPVTVLTETAGSTFFHPDFAVLELASAPGIQPLAFTPEATQLDQVIATGFPAAFLLEEGNQAYARLSGVMHGDMAEMPAMIATEGRISAIQRAPTGLMVMPHTAEISSGNSGGPLVDACGRVVGVNTFIRDATDQIVHINYAQKADSAMAFLSAQRIAFTDVQTPCASPPATPTLSGLPATPGPPGQPAPQ